MRIRQLRSSGMKAMARVRLQAHSTLPWIAAIALVASAGCIDPLVSDEVPARSELLLAAGSVIPLITDDDALTAQIDANDGIDGKWVPRLSGFSNGQPAYFWDFGEASPWAIPLFILVKDDPEGTFVTDRGTYSRVPGHWAVIDAIPGDVNYSPFWSMTLVPITDAYNGQILTSLEAIVEAERVGLVDTFITLPVVVNCPIVLPDVRLEVQVTGSGEAFLTPDPGYYRGNVINYFTFGTSAAQGRVVATGQSYTLRRSGGEPLVESERHMDITNDGDEKDSNDLFALMPGQPGYSGLVQLTEVVMTADFKSIDSYQDGMASDIKDVAQLFVSADTFDPATVVAHKPLETLVNRPLSEMSY